jgi:two-component system CheB/CheR fusion protein
MRDDTGHIKYTIGTGIDITERRRMERDLLAISDEERRRIGQDLHDMSASQLAGTAMMTRVLARKVKADETIAADDLQKVADLINESGEQARALSHSLMPLEVHDGGLTTALQKLVERQQALSDIPCTFGASDTLPELGEQAASHLYRIAAEAIANALKHAEPHVIDVQLSLEEGHLVLRVRDEGAGISDDAEVTNGIGLHMMQYRADLIEAHLSIRPDDAGGTVVQCSLPIKRATDAVGSASG